MLIRRFLEGEEQLLMDIFSSSIRENAKLYYNEDQLKAWAPIEMDKNKWDERIRSIKPYIIEDAGEILGYADLQLSGYIDHFFVKGGQANRGIGSQLMNYILLQAKESNLKELTADVSLAAQVFFEKFGFEVVRRKTVVIRGITLENALMHKHIDSSR